MNRRETEVAWVECRIAFWMQTGGQVSKYSQWGPSTKGVMDGAIGEMKSGPWKRMEDPREDDGPERRLDT